MKEQSVEEWMDEFLQTGGLSLKDILWDSMLRQPVEQPRKRTIRDFLEAKKPKSAPTRFGKKYGYDIDHPSADVWDFTLFIGDKVRQKESRNANGDPLSLMAIDKSGRLVKINYKKGKDGKTYPAEIINGELRESFGQYVPVARGLKTQLNEDGSIKEQNYVKGEQSLPVSEPINDALKQAMDFYTKTVDQALSELHGGNNPPPPPHDKGVEPPPPPAPKKRQKDFWEKLVVWPEEVLKPKKTSKPKESKPTRRSPPTSRGR